MSDYNISCVLIVPATLQLAGNILGESLGHGPDTYSIVLSQHSHPDVLSHYAAHSWVRPDFIQLIQAGQSGILPQELLDKGFTSSQVTAFLSQIILSARNYGEPLDHFNSVLSANGLIRYGTVE